MNALELFKNITTLVFDVDGVLTDGSLVLLPNGTMARTMNIKDGYALQLAVKKEYHVVAISGASSAEVIDRLHYLGITEVFTGVKNKVTVLQDFLSSNDVCWDEVLYMGDDIPDLEVMKKVGLPCCPQDAVTEIRAISKYISSFSGGRGCARDVIEKVMKLNNTWSEDTAVRAK